MKLKKILFMLLLLASAMLFAEVLSVYDIQYTEESNGNSPYSGQTDITVGGIVTANGYSGDKFFLSDRSGGPWSGIYVYDYNIQPEIGDSVQVTGQVQEYNNLTEMSYVSGSTITVGNPVPEPSLITCADLTGASAEQWEGVLVTIKNATCSSIIDNYGEFRISDSSGVSIYVSDGIISHQALNPEVGEAFLSITGVVDYAFGNFKIVPRSNSDIQQPSINIPEISVDSRKDFMIPIRTYAIDVSEDITSYEFHLSYDSDIISIYDTSLDESVTDDFNGEVTLENEEDNKVKVTCSFQNEIFVDDDNSLLISLKAKPVGYGSSELVFDSFLYNTDPALLITNSFVNIPYEESKPYLQIYTDDSDKNIFNPHLSSINIDYGSSVDRYTGFKVILSIYNSKGQLENTLFNGHLVSSFGVDSFSWDGKDREHRMLPPGMYICHLEIINLESGKKRTKTQPIVISTEL